MYDTRSIWVGPDVRAIVVMTREMMMMAQSAYLLLSRNSAPRHKATPSKDGSRGVLNWI